MTEFKWHKIKDEGAPKKEGKYLVTYMKLAWEERYYSTQYYEHITDFTGVEAWAEIPEYKEET